LSAVRDCLVNILADTLHKLGREAMIPYLARLLDITMNNNAIPSDWKKAIVVPTYKGADQSVVGTIDRSA